MLIKCNFVKINQHFTVLSCSLLLSGGLWQILHFNCGEVLYIISITGLLETSESRFVLKANLCIWRERRLPSERVGVNGHVLYPCLCQRSERLLIDGKFLQFVQSFQSVDYPETCWRDSVNLFWSISNCEAHSNWLTIIISLSYMCTGCVLSKHGVLHVQVRLFGVCEEELGAVGVGAVVRHGDHASDVVLEEKDTKLQQALMKYEVKLLESVKLTLRCSLYSSSNLRPQILVPPLPVPERGQQTEGEEVMVQD